MVESLILFENSRWFLQTSIILFFNKIDVFKSKLAKVIPLSRSLLHLELTIPHRRCFANSTRKIFTRIYH